MKNNCMRTLTIAIVILVVGALPSFAQGSGTTLKGRVVDSSGAVLPGVTVTATEINTGYSRSTDTGSDGTFQMGGMQVGTYTIVAELAGFGTTKITDVRLNVASERDLDVTLSQASISEMITVTADAPLIATSPSIGTVVSQEELEGLPLNGRQFANLRSSLRERRSP